MPSLEIPIFKWKCTFYLDKEKRWIEGELQLNEDQVCVVHKEDDETMKARTIKFFKITTMTKEKSSYIYPCIVLYTTKKDVVWISSLINRDDTFNKLEHFWRQSLLDTRATNSSLNKNQELLSIAYETQGVLLDASNQLHRQGKQLDSSSRTLEKIHNDITVAERITGDIESWFGAWRVKGRFKSEKANTDRVDSCPLGQQSIDYPVLYGKVAQESHKSGQIVLKDGQFELLDEKYEVVHSFAIDMISEVDIHSPWDVTIIKRTFGKPLVRIHLTSARMPMLLKRLRQCKGPEYDLDNLPQETTKVDSIEELDGNCGGNESGNQHSSFSGVQTLHKDITNKDANELSKVLNSMKHMATNVSVEQDAQLKQIDKLTDSVDRAKTRLNATSRRVNDAC